MPLYFFRFSMGILYFYIFCQFSMLFDGISTFFFIFSSIFHIIQWRLHIFYLFFRNFVWFRFSRRPRSMMMKKKSPSYPTLWFSPISPRSSSKTKIWRGSWKNFSKKSTRTPLFCISRWDSFLHSCWIDRNKAGYTATLVACGWVGAMIEKVTGAFGQEQWAQNAQRQKK